MLTLSSTLDLQHAANGDPDGLILMHGIGWPEYEAMLAIRGDRLGVRLSFLEGGLEIMSPSGSHASVREALGRLLEAYAGERGIYFYRHGSATMKNLAAECGAEPDECYVVGRPSDHPDLAIDVLWTPGGIDRQRLYAGLAIRELWQWRDGRIDVFVLRGTEYVARAGSDVLPAVDLDLLARLIEHEDQDLAVHELRATLRR